MSIIIQKGNATSVDHTEYDLTLDQAAQELSEGRNVIAREYEDYTDDYSFPEVETLLATNYTGKTTDEIIESIRGWYECFGRAS